MEVLKGELEKEALLFIEQAASIAKAATCERSKCGSVIVKEGRVIGAGFNTPPMELESQRRCFVEKAAYDKKVTDKTCCVHAEQRAIVDALQVNSNELSGSRLYFVRLDGDGNKSYAGKPYCTICSKLALDSGIAEFVLRHKEGVCVYTTEEYNDLSFLYKEA